MVSGIEHVTRVAEAAGWNVAMYQYAQAQIGDGGVLAEDERSADWRFLLPSSTKMG